MPRTIVVLCQAIVGITHLCKKKSAQNHDDGAYSGRIHPFALLMIVTPCKKGQENG
jgi:hypothetical protein